MYELMIESKFAAAHQLRGYQGKCEKLHGHNWRVTIAVTAERLDDIGLAIDFHDLKKSLRDVLDQLEHTFLNDIFPFTQINPSSENLAKWIYDTMTKKVNDDEHRSRQRYGVGIGHGVGELFRLTEKII